MNKNKIKKYLNETFITEKFVKGVKYNIRNANNGPNDKGDNYTYIDNLEGGRFKSDDGHFFTIGDTGSNWKISQINEDKKPKGLSDTEKVQKDSEKFTKKKLVLKCLSMIKLQRMKRRMMKLLRNMKILKNKKKFMMN